MTIKKSIAALLTAVLFYTSTAAPLAQAGFWEERRHAVSGKSSGEPAQASLSQVLPLGEKVLNGYVPLSADVVSLKTATKKTLPAWMTGLVTPFAEVEDFSLAPGFDPKTQPLVLLVQDVHTHVESQQNMSKMFSALADRYDLRLVGLEGARGGFVNGVWRNAAKDHMDDLAFTADLLVEKHLIGGAEHFGLTAPKEPLLWGVENQDSYVANVNAYRRTVPFKDAVKDYEGRLAAALTEIKSKVFSPELKALDQKAETYAAGTLNLGDYLTALVNVPNVSSPNILPSPVYGGGWPEARRGEASRFGSPSPQPSPVNGGGSRTPEQLQKKFPAVAEFMKAYALEKSIDFKKAEAERNKMVEALTRALSKTELDQLVSLSLEFRVGRISFGDYYGHLKSLAARRGVNLDRTPALRSYIEYALAADRIRKDQLFDEIPSLEKETGDRLAKSGEQKEALSLTRDARLLSRLFHYEMTPQDWSLWQNRRAAENNINDRLASFGLSLPAQTFPAPLTDYESFYVSAFGRNDDLLNNFLTKTKNVPAATSGRTPIVALVTGGFHTAGLRDLLAKKKISYAVFTPRVTSIDGAGSSLDELSRPYTPLENMVLGRAVFLQTARGLEEKSVDPSQAAPGTVPTAAALALTTAEIAGDLENGVPITRASVEPVVAQNAPIHELEVEDAQPSGVTLKDPNTGASIEATIGKETDPQSPLAFSTRRGTHVSLRAARRRLASNFFSRLFKPSRSNREKSQPAPSGEENAHSAPIEFFTRKIGDPIVDKKAAWTIAKSGAVENGPGFSTLKPAYREKMEEVWKLYNLYREFDGTKLRTPFRVKIATGGSSPYLYRQNNGTIVIHERAFKDGLPPLLIAHLLDHEFAPNEMEGLRRSLRHWSSCVQSPSDSPAPDLPSSGLPHARPWPRRDVSRMSPACSTSCWFHAGWPLLSCSVRAQPASASAPADATPPAAPSHPAPGPLPDNA